VAPSQAEATELGIARPTPPLSSRERRLYQQVHPVKLLVDGAAAAAALVLLWRHSAWLGIGVALVPPIVASVTLWHVSDLSSYRSSRIGRYLRQHMTLAAEAFRVGGFIVMALGAWERLAWVLVLGAALIARGWLHGLLRPRPLEGRHTRERFASRYR
jgi:hypothetical protein